MTFIITLISLLIERFFDWSHMRNWSWFAQYEQWISKRVANWPPYALLLLDVLPLVVIVALINLAFGGWLYGLFKLILGILVLTYCLGPQNLWAELYACIRELSKEDPKSAIVLAEKSFDIGSPSHSQGFHQALTKAIFIAANQRVFSVVFWFVVAGPVGALFYRTIFISAHQSTTNVAMLAEKVKHVLDWVPARLFALFFALGGHFTQVFECWKKYAPLGLESNDVLLSECGVAALDVMKDGQLPEDGSAEKESIALLDRVFIILLVILALVVIVV